MLKLNGAVIPHYVKVNKVEFSILPPIENKLLNVRGRKGSYFMQQEFGTRKISVDITLIAEEINGVMSLAREFASWLYHDKPVKFEIDDEPDKYYMVVLDGETELDEIANIGQGTLDFLCVEPFAYGAEKTSLVGTPTEEPFNIVNTGNTTTYPQIELTMKQNVSEITVVSDDGYVVIGKPTPVDVEVVDDTPLQLSDDMSTINTFTSGILVDGAISGTLKSNGYAISADNYGTGTGWHGGAMTRTLPKTLKDFEITYDITLACSDKKQIGRIELYLFDANNNNLGKIALKDTNPNGETQGFEARVGNIGTGQYFANVVGSTLWTDFTGRLKLKRKGKIWEAWIGKWDSKKKQYVSTKTYSFVDKRGTFSANLAKVQIHIGQYGTYATPTSAYISHLAVYDRLTLGAGQVPIIAKVGDVLTIDNEKAIVLKNGVPFYEGIHADSKFFGLNAGINGIVVSPPLADVSVTYKERWL